MLFSVSLFLLQEKVEGFFSIYFGDLAKKKKKEDPFEFLSAFSHNQMHTWLSSFPSLLSPLTQLKAFTAGHSIKCNLFPFSMSE